MNGLETVLKHLFTEQNRNKQWLSKPLVADGTLCGKQNFDGADVINLLPFEVCTNGSQKQNHRLSRQYISFVA